VLWFFLLFFKTFQKVNQNYGLKKEKVEVIIKAAQEVIDGKLDDHFPLVIWFFF
jgi:fumarate hydratase class II